MAVVSGAAELVEVVVVEVDVAEMENVLFTFSGFYFCFAHYCILTCFSTRGLDGIDSIWPVTSHRLRVEECPRSALLEDFAWCSSILTGNAVVKLFAICLMFSVGNGCITASKGQGSLDGCGSCCGGQCC